MGFDAGIYKVKRYSRDITPENIFTIEKYIEWEKNDWAKKHFTDPEAFAIYNYGNTSEDRYVPTEDIINFYKDTIHDSGYGSKIIYEEMLYFGRPAGTNIHDWFIEHLGKDFKKELSKDLLIEFLSYCWSEYKPYLPEFCTVNHAYKYEVTEDEDYESAEIRLIPCDGIEIEIEDKGYKRIDTNSDWNCELLIQTNYCDSDYIHTLQNIIESCINILNTTDFDNEMLYYSGGW